MKDTDSIRGGRFPRLLLGGGILLVVGSLGLVVSLSAARRTQLHDEEQMRLIRFEAGPRVRVVSADQGPDMRTIVLPGEARPYATVTLYSKVSGFLSEIKVDKGDKVAEGDVLAVVSSPELDRQYDAAVADAKNKRADAERARTLVQTESISPQNGERSETAAEVAEQTAASLRAQKEYEVVKAPFYATVTARYADPGALLQNAANSQTTALPIVTLSQVDRLRVYVYPDQSTATLIRKGDHAEISNPAMPDLKVTGTVSRTSGELDTKTRTLLVEIEVDNPHGRILAGSAVQVALSVRIPRLVQVPVAALIIKDDKPFVGVITEDNRIRLRPVSIQASNGKLVKLNSGIAAGERIALNAGSAVSDGDHVQPVGDSPVGQN
jgi:membrane fusion protein, multidrug efflux system